MLLFFAAVGLGSNAITAQEQENVDAGTQSADKARHLEAIQVFPTSAFAARSQLRGARISPDGRRIASSGNYDGKDYVVLFDGATGTKIGSVPLSADDRVKWLRWAGNDKILLSAAKYDKYNRYFSQLFVLDLADGLVFPIRESSAGLDQDDVIFLAEDGSHMLLTIQRTRNNFPSVFRYPLTENGKRQKVASPKPGVWDWISDNSGIVRIGIGYRRDVKRIYYRSNEADEFKITEKTDLNEFLKPNGTYRYFEILGIQPGTDIGYVLFEDDTGKVALKSYDFAASQIAGTLFEHPTADIEQVGFSSGGEPIWVSYTSDRPYTVWLDEDLRSLQKGLAAALPEEEVGIVSRSRDDQRIIVNAGGPGDPGALYLFDREKRSLEALGETKPGLDFRYLAKPKVINYSARDGTKIEAILTLPPGRSARDLPLVIMPHGGPYGVRDSLRYDDWAQLLANRGYAVIQPNYRGSGGYGDGFFDLGIGQIGRAMQDDLDDAMDSLIAQGVVDRARVCIVGASYGGYAAIWGITRNPERYRCAASWAGVTDWDSLLLNDSRFFSRQASRRWSDRVQGDEDFDLEAISPLKRADDIKRPLLLAHGTDDGRVNVTQYHQLRLALEKRRANLTTLLIEGEGHSFYEEKNELKWFDALVDFLKQHNPADS